MTMVISGFKGLVTTATTDCVVFPVLVTTMLVMPWLLSWVYDHTKYTHQERVWQKWKIRKKVKHNFLSIILL